jgi:hypothetical protein
LSCRFRNASTLGFIGRLLCPVLLELRYTATAHTGARAAFGARRLARPLARGGAASLGLRTVLLRAGHAAAEGDGHAPGWQIDYVQLSHAGGRGRV